MARTNRYLDLGRRALTALAPEIDRQRRTDPRRMRIAALALLVLVPAKARAQAPSELPASPPTPAPAVPAFDSEKATFGGWVEAGYAANFDRPADRVNFGANFDWRANDYRLNQVYLSARKPLDEGAQPSVGYRVDFLAGHDAPFFVANGLFSNFTGFDPMSGVGTDGPASGRDVNAIGIDLPQFYLDLRFPRVLTDAGIDVRVGKFFTLMGREVYPAADTDFYSRAYENVYATPFTHTGFLVTLHATPTLDVVAGVVEGWDVFKDNNDAPTFHGAFIWNSPDKRCNWTTTWITGPEQPGDVRDYRTLVTSYLTANLDSAGKWTTSSGGHYAWEANAARNPATGLPETAKWYGATINLFRTVGPEVRLGTRLEWFRDEEGTRTGLLGRPGFAADFFEATLGATWKPLASVSLRPEARLDWSPDSRPFNDQLDRTQLTLAADLIWTF